MDCGMVGSYFIRLVQIAFRFSIRVADVLQIFLFFAVPAFYRLWGVPMPDGGVDAFAVWVAYAVVTWIAFRLIVYAPYVLWKEQLEKAETLQSELDKPEAQQKAIIATELAQQRLALSTQVGHVLSLTEQVINSVVGSPTHKDASAKLSEHMQEVRRYSGVFANEPEIRGLALDVAQYAGIVASTANEHGDYREDKTQLVQFVQELQNRLLYSSKSELPAPLSPQGTESGKQH